MMAHGGQSVAASDQAHPHTWAHKTTARQRRGPACTAFLPESTTNLQIPGAAQYEKGCRTQGGKSLVALWESYMGKTHGSSLPGWHSSATSARSAGRSLASGCFVSRLMAAFQVMLYFQKPASASSNPTRNLSWTRKRFFIPHPCSGNGLSPHSCKHITKPRHGAGYPCSPKNLGFFPEG